VRERIGIWSVAAVTFGSGLLNLYSVVGPAHPANLRRLRAVFPLEFIDASRNFSLLIGFALVAVSFSLLKQKRRAWKIAIGLCLLSCVFHLTKGLNYEEAAVCGIVALVLLLNPRLYRVRSRTPALSISFVQLAIVFIVVFAYGVVGFWLLEPRHFGINLDIGKAIRSTFTAVTFFGDARIVPQTRHAVWFLQSLHVMTFILLGYIAWVLFQPRLLNRARRMSDVKLAGCIREKYGRSSLDYFKTWPDKTIFISSSERSFLAYGVALGFAIVLGDPVGPDDDLEEIIREFTELCCESGWRIAFYQVDPDFLSLYQKAGYKKLKIGEDAMVDLQEFSLERKDRRLRSKVKDLDKIGIHTDWIDAPIPKDILLEAREVSDDWLKIPGRRERKFTLGWFDEDYIRCTPLLVARDPAGAMLAFVNFIRSFGPNEAESDLMRRRSDAPNGIMDYLFVKCFFTLKDQGYARYNMRMAPMSGFQKSENPKLQERAIHTFFQQWERIFSFQGLRFYKAKFATNWEPRYVVYRNVLDLSLLPFALARISAFHQNEVVQWAEEERDELKVA
jgi:phosphatidylglycerol lysyltransferase